MVSNWVRPKKRRLSHQNVTSRTISQPHLPHLPVDISQLTNVQTISCKIKKGERGFGFTVADSETGQFVKQVVEQDRYVQRKISRNFKTKISRHF